jgi:hypothetical protein
MRHLVRGRTIEIVCRVEHGAGAEDLPGVGVRPTKAGGGKLWEKP